MASHAQLNMLPKLVATDHSALATRDGVLSWEELLEQVERYARELEHFRGQRLALRLASTPESVAMLLACERAGVHVFLIAHDAPPERAMAWATRFGFTAVLFQMSCDFLLSLFDTHPHHSH